MKPLPGGAGFGGVARKPISRPIVLALIAVLAIVAARMIFGQHDNAYERVARDVTAALQKNDVAAVRSYQEAGMAANVTASRVGRGADDLAPLGTIKSVKQTSFDNDTGFYGFDVDPDKKIVRFHYDEPLLTK